MHPAVTSAPPRAPRWPQIASAGTARSSRSPRSSTSQSRGQICAQPSNRDGHSGRRAPSSHLPTAVRAIPRRPVLKKPSSGCTARLKRTTTPIDDLEGRLGAASRTCIPTCGLTMTSVSACAAEGQWAGKRRSKRMVGGVGAGAASTASSSSREMDGPKTRPSPDNGQPAGYLLDAGLWFDSAGACVYDTIQAQRGTTAPRFTTTPTAFCIVALSQPRGGHVTINRCLPDPVFAVVQGTSAPLPWDVDAQTGRLVIDAFRRRMPCQDRTLRGRSKLE
ncbi:hypothetical protein B0H15DRAFT_605144 [Mycena belliarum]|uniref:Uncharacterized protein n=1 Tax=Mycena belliarum TaxID=1033014 RepID=A0AAD6TVC0_9AGAR|nr:hypothetical protein B0H15DRAFT_605144 [Mycena belliae]